MKSYLFFCPLFLLNISLFGFNLPIKDEAYLASQQNINSDWAKLTDNFDFLFWELNSSEIVDGCLDAEYGQYPITTFEPFCIGIAEDITTIGWAGEYSKVLVTNGMEYVFSSSVSTDYITIGDSNGTQVLAYGTGSVTWTSNFNGVIRFYTHLNSSCASSNTTSRARMVQCGDIIPIPENDECENAIALNCGDTGVGSTFSADDSGGRPSKDVFYTYTGNGTPEFVTMSLCGSSYNTYIHVYSDCSLTSEIGYGAYGCNINSGDLSSIVSFTSDGVSTYVILVEGYNTGDFGNFVYELTCTDVPPPPENCEDFSVLSNDFEYVGVFAAERLATDLPIGNNGFTAYGMNLNLADLIDNEPSYINFLIHNDNMGIPGNQLATRQGIIVQSNILHYSTIDGLVYTKYTVKFDTPLNFNPNTRYWVEVQSDAIGWEFSTVYGSLGYPDVHRSFSTGVWVPMENPETNFVFELICTELGVTDTGVVEFMYYPNPAKEILTIVSSINIRSVSVYNSVGQKAVKDTLPVIDGQINISSLSPGTYIFHVILENGQIETFKIVKK